MSGLNSFVESLLDTNVFFRAIGQEISGLASNLDNLNISEISKLSRLRDLNLVRGTVTGGVIGGGGQTAYDAATGNFSVGKAVNNVLGYGAMGGAIGLANVGRMASASKRKILQNVVGESGMIGNDNLKNISSSSFRKQFDKDNGGYKNPKYATEADVKRIEDLLDGNHNIAAIFSKMGKNDKNEFVDLTKDGFVPLTGGGTNNQKYEGTVFMKPKDSKQLSETNKELLMKMFLNTPNAQ